MKVIATVHLIYCRTLLSQSAASLTISSIAGYLNYHKINTNLILINKSIRNTCNRLVNKLTKSKADIIIAKINYQDYDIILDALKIYKDKNYNVRIALCGPFAVANSDSIIKRNSFVNEIISDYPELRSLDFALSTFEKHADLKNPTTISCRNYLNTLPSPNRYIENKEARKLINIEASRGCHFSCGFCHLANTDKSYRDPEKVADEIEALYLALGKRFFIFNDPCFWSGSHDTERVKAIASEIINRNIDIRFYVYLRINPLISKDILAILRKAGLVRVFLGVESSVGSIQKLFGKKISRRKFTAARHLFEQEFDINVHIGFITVAPYSTLEDIENNILFLYEIDKIFRIGIITEPLRIIPNSKIYNKLILDGILQSDSSYDQITYGYNYLDKRVEVFYKAIRLYLCQHYNDSATKFEYFSTTVSLLYSLLKFEKKVVSDLTRKKFTSVYSVREQCSHILYNFFTLIIEQVKTNLTISNDCNNELDHCLILFEKAVHDLKNEYIALTEHLMASGYQHLVEMLYTGQETINDVDFANY